jgi:hypothetical protein
MLVLGLTLATPPSATRRLRPTSHRCWVFHKSGVLAGSQRQPTYIARVNVCLSVAARCVRCRVPRSPHEQPGGRLAPSTVPQICTVRSPPDPHMHHRYLAQGPTGASSSVTISDGGRYGSESSIMTPVGMSPVPPGPSGWRVALSVNLLQSRRPGTHVPPDRDLLSLPSGHPRWFGRYWRRPGAPSSGGGESSTSTNRHGGHP